MTVSQETCRSPGGPFFPRVEGKVTWCEVCLRAHRDEGAPVRKDRGLLLRVYSHCAPLPVGAGRTGAGCIRPHPVRPLGVAVLRQAEAGSILFEVRDVAFSYEATSSARNLREATWCLQDISCTIRAGECVGIIGPNGSGKTTLLRLLAGVLRPGKGMVMFQGRSVSSYPRRQIAQQIAVVPQEEERQFGFTVREAVLMGRIPYLNGWQREGAADWAAAERAMQAAGVQHLADRRITHLSGGESQRVTLARALAQEPRVLLLDEPTAHLDVHYQAALLDAVADLHAAGMTVVMTLHDLNLASLYCQRVLLLAGGRLLADGPPAEVFIPSILQAAYGPRVDVAPHPLGGPLIYVTPGSRTRGSQARA